MQGTAVKQLSPSEIGGNVNNIGKKKKFGIYDNEPSALDLLKFSPQTNLISGRYCRAHFSNIVLPCDSSSPVVLTSS